MSWTSKWRMPRLRIEASRAVAFLRGRGYVVPEDVKEIAKDVLRHRVLLTYEAEAENVTSDTVVERILERAPAGDHCFGVWGAAVFARGAPRGRPSPRPRMPSNIPPPGPPRTFRIEVRSITWTMLLAKVLAFSSTPVSVAILGTK